jgi:hypothetical protein
MNSGSQDPSAGFQPHNLLNLSNFGQIGGAQAQFSGLGHPGMGQPGPQDHMAGRPAGLPNMQQYFGGIGGLQAYVNLNPAAFAHMQDPNGLGALNFNALQSAGGGAPCPSAPPFRENGSFQQFGMEQLGSQQVQAQAQAGPHASGSLDNVNNHSNNASNNFAQQGAGGMMMSNGDGQQGQRPSDGSAGQGAAGQQQQAPGGSNGWPLAAQGGPFGSPGPSNWNVSMTPSALLPTQLSQQHNTNQPFMHAGLQLPPGGAAGLPALHQGNLNSLASLLGPFFPQQGGTPPAAGPVAPPPAEPVAAPNTGMLSL